MIEVKLKFANRNELERAKKVLFELYREMKRSDFSTSTEDAVVGGLANNLDQAEIRGPGTRWLKQ